VDNTVIWTARFSGVCLCDAHKSNQITLSVRKIIGVIVHDKEITVYRSEHMRLILMGQGLEGLFETSDRDLPPFVCVRSDRETCGFLLEELIETFLQKIMAPITDLCAEQMLFLENLEW
jgi:hypothetical protein